MHLYVCECTEKSWRCDELGFFHLLLGSFRHASRLGSDSSLSALMINIKCCVFLWKQYLQPHQHHGCFVYLFFFFTKCIEFILYSFILLISWYSLWLQNKDCICLYLVYLCRLNIKKYLGLNDAKRSLKKCR